MVSEKVSVAIIDDGINEEFYNLGPLKHNIEIRSDLAVIIRKDYNKWLPSHGTTCAAIIKSYSKNAELSSIKILNHSTMKCEKNQLIKAIEWCVENKIKIVNMSLGTIDFRDFEDVRTCVNFAYEKGVIIIGACSNKNVFTYPACLSNVIGVRGKEEYTGLQYKFISHPFDGIDVLASSSHHLSGAFGYEEDTFFCNSYAAPTVTALVCNIVSDKRDITLEEIKKTLWQGDKNNLEDKYNPYLKLDLDWITDKIIVNICTAGEEISDTLWDEKAASINVIIDDKLSLEADIFYALNKNLDYLSGFKNVILVFSQAIYNHERYIKKLLNYFNELDKNVVFIYKEECNSKDFIEVKDFKNSIWDAATYNKIISSQLKKEEELDIPLLYFYGGNPSELLAIIAEISTRFKKDGYNSTTISNEAIGKLEGIEYIPHGINLNRYLTTLYRKYNSDIIILGIIDPDNVNRKDNINEALDIDINMIDIYIEIDKCKITITAEDEKEVIGKNQDNNVIEIQKIYDKVIKYLI
nr:S8 family serine peptidase [Clostridium yunnanense]